MSCNEESICIHYLPTTILRYKDEQKEYIQYVNMRYIQYFSWLNMSGFPKLKT